MSKLQGLHPFAGKACFEGKLIHSPIELICYVVVFMKYWAGLNNSAYREMLVVGANAVKRSYEYGARFSLSEAGSARWSKQ
jgi:hypothetical protein